MSTMMDFARAGTLTLVIVATATAGLAGGRLLAGR